MIDDVARRHGGLRLGAAGCYLRSEDNALLVEVAADRRLSGLSLRTVAPTVLISPYLVSRVLDELRAAGYAPVQEDSGGGLVIARTRAFRAPPRRSTLSPSTFTDIGRGLTAPRLAAAVETLRRGDAAARAVRRAPATVRSAGPTDSQAHTHAMAVLQQAIRDKASVWVGYVDAHGSTTSRLLRPVSIGGGYLRAQDERTEMLHTFVLHRITAAVVDAER
jgi:predicted DNA-binding transcriptional regulator YafY